MLLTNCLTTDCHINQSETTVHRFKPHGFCLTNKKKIYKSNLFRNQTELVERYVFDSLKERKIHKSHSLGNRTTLVVLCFRLTNRFIRVIHTETDYIGCRVCFVFT